MITLPSLKPFSEQFNSGRDASPVLLAVKQRTDCVRFSISERLEPVVAATKVPQPADYLFNPSYYKPESVLHHTAARTTTNHEVEVVAVKPEPQETILDQKTEFDPHAFDLIAEAVLADDANVPVVSLANTEVTTPEAQEQELQAMIEQELSNAASRAAVTTSEANAHLAQVTK